MSLITTIPALAFPQEIDVLEFSRAGGSTAESVNVVLQLDSNTILDVDLAYDANSRAKISGLADFLQTYANDGTLHTLSVQADGASVASGKQVLGCSLKINDTALQFCSKSFLSADLGLDHTPLPVASLKEKLTYPGAKEYVSLLLSSSANMTITRTWLDASGAVVQDSATQELSAGLQTIDVSPMEREGMKLLCYDVRCGDRHKRLIADHDKEGEVVSIKFHNVFGLPDTIHFFGAVEKEIKPTRQSAVIDGQLKNYHVEVIPTWKAHVFAHTYGSLIHEFVSTTYAERCSDGCPIVLMSEDVKISSERHSLGTASVSWRESNSRYSFTPKYRVRTFDATFDTTFE